MKYSDFDDEISKYDKIKEQQIEIIQNSKVATIEVEKAPKKSENSNKSYTLTIKEMYQVLTLIETLNFIPKTCNNEVIYSIKYINENEVLSSEAFIKRIQQVS